MGVSHYDDAGPCARCGVRCVAEFCKDCKSVDPVMTAGGRGSVDMRTLRMRRRAAQSAVFDFRTNTQRERAVS